MFKLPLIVLGLLAPLYLADGLGRPLMMDPIRAECEIATTTYDVCRYDVCESESVVWSPIDGDGETVDADTCGLCFCLADTP